MILVFQFDLIILLLSFTMKNGYVIGISKERDFMDEELLYGLYKSPEKVDSIYNVLSNKFKEKDYKWVMNFKDYVREIFNTPNDTTVILYIPPEINLDTIKRMIFDSEIEDGKKNRD